jgi:hypothetical protein
MPNKKTRWNNILMWIGCFLGDQPNDYEGIFSELGYEAYVEELGYTRYKYIQVKTATLNQS